MEQEVVSNRIQSIISNIRYDINNRDKEIETTPKFIIKCCCDC